MPRPPIEPPPAYHQPPPVTGPLFADDAPTTGPSAAGQSPFLPVYPSAPSYPPAAAPQPPLPSYDDQGRARRRAPIVLLAVAALVAALIGAGGVVLLFGNDDDQASDTAVEGRDDEVDATTDAGDATTPTTTATESATDEPASFRCWDGGPHVARLEECAPPSGVAGLSWVFPSSAGSTCSAGVGAQRATEVDCSPIVDGEAVRFHYSEWRSRSALEAYYGGKTITTISAPDGRSDLTAARVDSRASGVGYKVALYYTDPSAIWSVTIYAADEAQYQAAVAQLQVRPFQQLRGERD